MTDRMDPFTESPMEIPHRPRQRPARSVRMRAVVYIAVWATLAVALVLDDPTGERLPTLAPHLAVALAITILDLATCTRRRNP